MRARLILQDFKVGTVKVLGVAFNKAIKGNSLELVLQEFAKGGAPIPEPKEYQVLISEPLPEPQN